jgi:chemotaxis protein CheD
MNEKMKDLYFLHPSTMHVSKDPKWIITILGSCVAVCMFDRQKGIGGINHFMLPYWNGDGLESPKYGNVAIGQLYTKMLDFGAKKDDIVCKIFGGGEVLGENILIYNVGQRNVELATKLIGEMGIQIVSHSTGGKLGRKIYFNSSTGEVLQKYLIKNESK